MLRALLLSVIALDAAAAEVHVFAAASLADVLKEIAAPYEKASGDRIVFNFAGSNTLARQIAAGAPADLFVSADEAQMSLVAHLGKRSIASNRLVLVVARDVTATDPARMRSMALADPRAVPAGVYAKAWLQRTGMWEAVRDKLVPTDNVRAALAAVEAGNVDAAIVYRSDARRLRTARVVREIPMDGISYPAAIVRDSPAARRFLQHLSSRAARDIFLRHGFL